MNKPHVIKGTIMKRIIRLKFLTFLFLLLLCQNAFCEQCERWDASIDSMSFWEIDNPDVPIKIIDYEGKKSVRIQRNTQGSSYILKKIKTSFDGNYGFRAVFQSSDIKKGNEHYERGKFQVILFDQWNRNLSQKRGYWPGEDFDYLNGWKTLVFPIKNVKKGQVMMLRIGLQSASGTVYLSAMEHCFLGNE
jgi:hypothetical protein